MKMLNTTSQKIQKIFSRESFNKYNNGINEKYS